MGEIRSGPDEEDGVAIYEAGDGRDVDLVGRCWAGDEVDSDAKVFACFAEGCVSCTWEDPVLVISR